MQATIDKPEGGEEITLEQLVMRLERIAKKNNDRFRYKVTIEPNRKGIVYLFYCEETAERHTLLCGSGVTIDEAVKQAWESIESACEKWNYDVVT